MKLHKYYVDVITMIHKDGSLCPMIVNWKGRKFKVEKIQSVRETFSPAGGCGICYECRIAGEDRRLFWEQRRWFIESRVYIPPEEL